MMRLGETKTPGALLGVSLGASKYRLVKSVGGLRDHHPVTVGVSESITACREIRVGGRADVLGHGRSSASSVYDRPKRGGP